MLKKTLSAVVIASAVLAAGAVSAAETNPLAADRLTDDVVKRAREAFNAQLAMRDPQAPWVAEDAVYQYALTEYGLRGSGVNVRVEGRPAVLAYLRALADNAPKATISNLYVFPTLEPDLVFVQYQRTPADGSKPSMPLAIIEMRGKEIARYTQLGRSPEILQALKTGIAPGN